MSFGWLPALCLRYFVTSHPLFSHGILSSRTCFLCSKYYVALPMPRVGTMSTIGVCIHFFFSLSWFIIALPILESRVNMSMPQTLLGASTDHLVSSYQPVQYLVPLSFWRWENWALGFFFWVIWSWTHRHFFCHFQCDPPIW